MTNAEQPFVRGALLLGIQTWFKSELSSTAQESFSTKLQAGVAHLITDRSVVNQSKIPADQFRLLCDEMIATWGLDGPRGFHAIIGCIALSDLRGYMKVLMRVGTPLFVLNRFPRVWHHYFSHGELSVEEGGERSAEVCIRGAGVYGTAAIEGSFGWMQGALEYSGAKGVRVTKRAVSDPNNLVFLIQWN